ncbi:hypothetical protein D9757_013497 [Collybiopsis confluens]|uniref:Uncharacterized protein n=1 Tax=Collybiopsis confluens TaxID=2823264 RepID=A0A8H5FSQ5_9AGAR|nr:hypothetical protein D9757_013497 [Collybiopsis confluens]
MEFQYSFIVDPTTYDTEGLCDGIELRKSSFARLEDRGIIRAQQDWAKYVGPLPSQEFRGTMGLKYSFLSVCVPECLPERLEILGYANEFAFLYDDIIDSFTNTEKSTIENEKLLQAFREGAQSGRIIHDPESERGGWKKMQSNILLDLLAIDREGALHIVKAWAAYSQTKQKEFSALEEYLPYRVENAGGRVWIEFVIFAMNLKLSALERSKAEDLTRPAYFALALQNDVCSWEKEYAQAQVERDEQQQSIIMNAISILMQEYNIDTAGAQQLCRLKIKQYVTEYIQVVEDVKQEKSFSVDFVKYIEALKHNLVGHAAWCMTCPRHQPHISFTEEQLQWMRSGVPPGLAESGTPKIENEISASCVKSEGTIGEVALRLDH